MTYTSPNSNIFLHFVTSCRFWKNFWMLVWNWKRHSLRISQKVFFKTFRFEAVTCSLQNFCFEVAQRFPNEKHQFYKSVDHHKAVFYMENVTTKIFKNVQKTTASCYRNMFENISLESDATIRTRDIFWPKTDSAQNFICLYLVAMSSVYKVFNK